MHTKQNGEHMSYCILRVAKLQRANVASSASHNFRERPTPNADSSRTHSNITHGPQDTKQLVAAMDKRLESVEKIRKNAVCVIEYLMTASPEFFQSASIQQRDNYLDSAEQWLIERHGAENIICCTRHLDETSPHICAYVVPITSNGKLNASYWLDGRKKLSDMQTDFAQAVGQSFKLERGIEGSLATHTTIQQFYASLNSPVKKPFLLATVDVLPQVAGERSHLDKMESADQIAKRISMAANEYFQPAIAAGNTAKLERKRADELERTARRLDRELQIAKNDLEYRNKQWHYQQEQIRNLNKELKVANANYELLKSMLKPKELVEVARRIETNRAAIQAKQAAGSERALLQSLGDEETMEAEQNKEEQDNDSLSMG
jgi:hypothetical protein